ncbi:hypothetical protein DL766_010459 [Monosporascus sp. MC13-8B]|uniref:non-specific serine/threonine protein kinase n=1 Tax=Monosporascus cannonballus TaxID=155416 RepID=A0ABY0H0Z4_9PEZI|nr:hypothetical protein DL762_008110 [Monosporascus cannonballus]RYO81954.1 hypothetical protein DL763_008405 [Monosporascus cannonballus]RYP01813.1 hypothetical protein DL766_010459 [Monosporascus sp. MC13-8B]
MSFFHRPTDPSSESSEDDTASDAGHSHSTAELLPNAGSAVEEVAQSNGAPAASASDARSTVLMSDLQSEPTVDAGTSIDEYRNIILASLLEDYYRTRAADYFNKAHPGKNYNRQSPEVQPLAEQLFSRAGQALSSNGLLSSSSASSSLQSTRQQYLSGLDNLAAAGLTPGAELLNPMRDLVMQSSKLSLIPHNTNELQLTIQSPFRSHYQANFEERGLLGKGAFGKVFRCYNPLDQKTYAVKKIRLSPKLSREFSEGRHGEMEDILREVKALAKLDHVNVVRYHATWIEQPHQPPVSVVNQARSDSAGLQYIHAKGLIHRDIKPGNIFLSEPQAVFYSGYCDVSCRSCVVHGDGLFSRWINPRIGDFGLVSQLATEGLFMKADGESYKPGAGSHKPVGTTYYRPPLWGCDDTVDDSESGAGPEDEKTDLFSLGVVFVEMLWRCGTAMERVDMLKGLQKGILPSGLEKNLQAEGLEPTVVRDILALARAMVDPNPAQRWEGAQVKEAIEGLLGRLSQ